MSDRAAFESAIAADPADLTARLVYADFLDETGDPADAARAEFVRAQVEVDALPPGDDHRRALVGRAAELFAGYWIDWWRPVCEAVGLPPPRVPIVGLWNRVARVFVTPRSVGWPYKPDGTAVRVADPPAENGPLRGLSGARFVRGWPEGLFLSGDLSEWAAPLRRWTAALPLTELGLYGSMRRDWAAIAGDHLRSTRHLLLVQCHTDAVREITTSPHLPGVTDLALGPDQSHPGWPTEQLRTLIRSPMAPRLERLTVALASREEAAAIGSADVFARLTDLTVQLIPLASGDLVGAVEVLAAAPFLPRLESFTLDAGPNSPRVPPEVEPALHRLLGALDPNRVRRIDLKGQQGFLPAVAELLAERFGDRVADRSVT
jgi:uncharacterized protein (TIGR02996 family)